MGQPPESAGPVSYGRRIRELGEADPTGVAIVFAAHDGSQRAVTWGELDRRANQIARLLQRRGAHRGSRVTVEIANSPLLVEVVLAIWKLGGVPIPVRWDLPVLERQRLLAVADPAAAISEHDLALLEATSAESDDALPDVTAPQAHGICSSGSTGAPKIIVALRPGLWDDANAEPFPSSWDPIPRPQVVLVPAPLYHTNGFSTLISLLAGDRLILLEKFDASRVVDLIEQHRVSTFTATPTMLQRIAAVPDIEHRNLSSLRWVLQGAAVIAPSLVRRWIDLIGPQQFFMAYGMSEGLGLAAIRGDEWQEHPGSVGKGYRQTEIRVLDSDHHDVPPGEISEIYLRSPSSALYEYLGGEPRLAATDDGFSTAGDVGWLDQDGYLYIVDRRVDMIVTGGANVFPAEVECALIDHPAIADVVVIGLADDTWGRRVHAIVAPENPLAPPSADEVIAFAKTRLAAYKAPKTVEFVDAVPRSEATKLNRSALVAARGG